MISPFGKTLKSTLTKVANFVKEIEEGIVQNETEVAVLETNVQRIQAEQEVLNDEATIGKKLLEKLQ